MKLQSSFAIAALLFVTLSVFSQTDKQLVLGEQPLYRVSRAKGPILVDGKMDELGWKDAEVRSFDYFFRKNEPLEKQKTKFRMLWDDKNIYLFYEFEDTSLTARDTSHDGAPSMDDCAEFFCIPYPDSLSMHFVFEVNMNKAAMDCIVLWQYHDNRSFFIWDYNPQYEIGVASDGTINNDKDTDKGWTMEFAIPFKVFSNFSPAKVGTKWAFQACRQDRNKVDDRFRSTSTLFPTYDIKLDVHPPNRFGLMEFTDN